MSRADSPIEVYKAYLSSKYLERKMPSCGKWPKLPSRKYINLTVIEKGEVSQEAALGNSNALVYGNIQAITRKGDISFQDVAKRDENGVLPKFVLVEGAPGVGKSTFAWEACRKWGEGKILEDFELVILIKLRDASIRNATCLGDLIQYPRDPAVREKVIDRITKSGGEKVLLLLEGYDELPALLRNEESIFTKVINGDQFDVGTVLVTSRHWASQPLLLPSDTNRPVSQHIEILGFTGENIKDYISSMLEKEPSLLKDLQQYLESCPHIRSMMYIPLNCAIVVEVFRHSKKESAVIPKTTTELYRSLTQSLLLRHTFSASECKKISLEDLPSSIKNHFDNLTELAYKGICMDQQQIIFAEEEIPSGLDTLGLMQSSMELFVDEGAKKSFNFLHLTIQEFLAAFHIFSHYSLESQVSAFRMYDTGMVAIFLSGLSPSSLYLTRILDIDKSVHYNVFQNKDIHRLFETRGRVEPPYDHCIGCPRNPFYSYMLGSVIARQHHPIVPRLRAQLQLDQPFLVTKGCSWEVWIEGRTETIDLFISAFSDCKDGQCRALAESEIAEFGKAKLALEKLEYVNAQARLYICIFFDNLSSGNPLSFKRFTFNWVSFNDEGTKEFLSYLATCSVMSLALRYCKFESNAAFILMNGVNACNSLKELTVKFNNNTDNGCGAICEMVTVNKNLKELQAFTWGTHSVCALADALHANHTLEKLAIARSVWVTSECPEYVMLKKERIEEVESVGLESLGIQENKEDLREASSRLSSKVAKILMHNKSLKELNICHLELDFQGDICTVLCKNQTLRILSISVEKGPELQAVCELLKRNKTIKVLELFLDIEGASTIAEVMCENDTLEELHIVTIEEGTEAFATILKRNRSLRKLGVGRVLWKPNEWDWTWIDELSKALSQNTSLLLLKLYVPGLDLAEMQIKDTRMQFAREFNDFFRL